MSWECEHCWGTGRIGRKLDLCGQRWCLKCDGTGMLKDERENVARLEAEAKEPDTAE